MVFLFALFGFIYLLITWTKWAKTSLITQMSPSLPPASGSSYYYCSCQKISVTWLGELETRKPKSGICLLVLFFEDELYPLIYTAGWKHLQRNLFEEMENPFKVHRKGKSFRKTVGLTKIRVLHFLWLWSFWGCISSQIPDPIRLTQPN